MWLAGSVDQLPRHGTAERNGFAINRSMGGEGTAPFELTIAHLIGWTCELWGREQYLVRSFVVEAVIRLEPSLGVCV